MDYIYVGRIFIQWAGNRRGWLLVTHLSQVNDPIGGAEDDVCRQVDDQAAEIVVAPPGSVIGIGVGPADGRPGGITNYSITVVVGIHVPCQTQLPLVVQARSHQSFLFGHGKSR